MNEQEIVNVLKENKTKGVAYMFLPEDIRDWITENFGNSNLLYLDSMGKWQYFKDADFDDYDNVVFVLPDMYELSIPKHKAEWVEFEIKDSCFTYSHSVGTSHLFDWFDWGFFLKASKKQGWGFTDFGGWQYESNGFWLTLPHVKNEEGLLTTLTNCNEDCRTVIPIKIRFWKSK